MCARLCRLSMTAQSKAPPAAGHGLCMLAGAPYQQRSKRDCSSANKSFLSLPPSSIFRGLALRTTLHWAAGVVNTMQFTNMLTRIKAEAT